MKANWIIEKDVFHEDETANLQKEILAQGMKCEIGICIPFEHESNHEILKLFDANDCVVVNGSINLVKFINHCNTPHNKLHIANICWIPGTYYHKSEFLCTKYYPAFKDDLLNSNYAMMPYGDLNRRKDWLYETFGRDDCIFIRPNSCEKLFTGKLMKKEIWDSEMEYLSMAQMEPEELLVVCEPVNILAEYRFVVIDKEVITGSMYRMNDVHTEQCIYPSEQPFVAAQQIADYMNWTPDSVWVLDICKNRKGQYKVVEIGSFSCAGLYACDLKIVVERVSRKAEQECKDYYGVESK